jgi:hypothetical protein
VFQSEGAVSYGPVLIWSGDIQDEGMAEVGKGRAEVKKMARVELAKNRKTSAN